MGGPEMAEDDPAARNAGLVRTARAVFWSFFGVRKRMHYESDAQHLNPVHVILMGIAGAGLFVALLLAIIKFVVLR
jgi:Protein of unknown function (DUF2970)